MFLKCYDPAPLSPVEVRLPTDTRPELSTLPGAPMPINLTAAEIRDLVLEVLG